MKGIANLELGKIVMNNNEIKSFKRYHPIDDGENCPNRAELVKKWKYLELEI